MKRCPECRRDYYDDSLSYCLDDGSELLEGPASMDEPATALLPSLDKRPAYSPQEARRKKVRRENSVKRNQLGNKAIAGGLVIFAVLLGAVAGYRYFAQPDRIVSMAVLPLQNNSGSVDSDYLSDGLAESLIYRLSQLPELKVSPASSVMRYKGKELDAPKIAAELGVQAVLSGRMSQRGDNLSISVELIDVANNRTVWGEQFDRKLSDLLLTQREIASTIVEKLQLKLSGAAAQGAARTYTESNEAYQSFLKGRYFLNKRSEENLIKAADEFQAAISKDPKFALAYVGLSETNSVMPFYGNVPSDATFREAKAYAERALQIDDSLGEAHSSLGYAEMYLWNWAQAEKELKRGIELNPNYSMAYKFYGNYLSNLGRFDEAAVVLRRAQELEPLSLIIRLNLGDAYLEQGDLKSASEQFRSAVELDPNWHVSRRHAALVYLKEGRNADAVAESEKSVELSNRQSLTLGFMGYVYSRAGNREKALELIEELKERYESGKANGHDIARIYVGLNDHDSAFEWLEKDFRSRNAIMAAWLYLTPFASLRDDPRFIDLAKRLGMQPAAKPST